MKVKKFNYVKFGIFIFVVVLILTSITIGIVALVKHIKYTKTYEYRLLQVGYSKDDVSTINNKLNDQEKEFLINKKYDSDSLEFLKEKYFIFENFDKYIAYKIEKKEIDNSRIVAIINTEVNVDWFEFEKKTDTSKGSLMLVNRLYGLDSDFEVEDLVSIPSKYAYSGKKISNSIMDDLIAMCDAASEDGYTLVVSNAYRSYKEQKKLYNEYADSYGKSYADEFVARPGHSEYETGLSLDLEPYGKSYKNPKSSDEYIWLEENAYKYGFIFRYTSEKEDLTLFPEDVWRLRYVGEDAATIIYNEGICFEEYYAYFVKER